MARSQVFNAADNFKAVIDSCVEKQTELDASGGKQSNHQSRLGAMVCRASLKP